jgi:hypothetical protein
MRAIVESNLEKKTFVSVLGATTFTTAGLVTPLTQGIIEGSGIDQRDGKMIIVKKLKLNIDLIGAATSHTVRVIIGADNMAQGALPGVTDILNTASYLSAYAPTNFQRNRFKILYDKTYSLILTASNERVTRELVYPLNHRVFYSSNADVAGANGKGCLFIMFVGSFNTATYNFGSQITFTDG